MIVMNKKTKRIKAALKIIFKIVLCVVLLFSMQQMIQAINKEK